MIVKNILHVENEIKRFLDTLEELRKEQNISYSRPIEHGSSTSRSKETASLKRASMDLTRALSNMRNQRD